MNYNYNCAAFRDGIQGGGLLEAYCRLVWLELRLKYRLGGSVTGLNGHDVPGMLDALLSELRSSQAAGNAVSVLTSKIPLLKSRLEALSCQGLDGRPAIVKAAKYPYIRYLRHDSDNWGSPQSSSTEIKNLVDSLQELMFTLSSECGIPS